MEEEDKPEEEENSTVQDPLEETIEAEVTASEELSEEFLTAEEFLALPDATPGRVTKIDYDAVTREILNKPLPLAKLKEIMLKHSTDKPHIYASEVNRYLLTLSKKGYTVLFKRKDDTKWVLVRRSSEP